MSERETKGPKVYEIASVMDFAKVPSERLEDCLHEFGAFVRMVLVSRELEAMFADLGKEPPMRLLTDRFTWIDDGKGEVRTTLVTTVPPPPSPDSESSSPERGD